MLSASIKQKMEICNNADGEKMSQKGINAIWSVLLLLGTLGAFMLMYLLGVMTPGSAIQNVKENEQANNELYALLEQDTCIDGVSFKEFVAHGIMQGVRSPDDEVTYYANGETEMKETIRKCVEEYMDVAEKANWAKVLDACDSDAGPFWERICKPKLYYKFEVQHGTCPNKICLSLSEGDVGEIPPQKQYQYIAVPEELPALIVLEIKRTL